MARPPHTACRPGTALVLALLFVLVLECVVIGTVHLALLERRLADNGSTALRLRLAAESGVRAGLHQWPAAADSLPADSWPLDMAVGTTPDGDSLAVTVQRIAQHDYIVRAEARGAGRGHARAVASLLVRPPALPIGVEIAAGAVSAGGALHAGPGAHISAGTAGCATVGAALLLAAPDEAHFDTGAVVDGVIGPFDAANDIGTFFDRMFHILAVQVQPALRVLSGDVLVDDRFDGVILVDGALTVAADAIIRGLVLVRGPLVLESGALVQGAVHVTGDAVIRGRVDFDACSAHTALSSAALRQPSPHPLRAWLPAY